MSNKKDHCFVIMPFGGYFDQYYNDIYKPAIEANGLIPFRADSLSRPSTIISDIWEFTKNAKILLADLTDTNPNVMYELGLAHAIAKPTILISEKIDSVPFDLRSLRVLTFDKNETNWDENLKEKIIKSISETLDSPIDAVLPTFLNTRPNIPEVSEFSTDLLEIKQLLNKYINDNNDSISSRIDLDRKQKSRVLSTQEFYEAVLKAKELYYHDGYEVTDIKQYLVEHYGIHHLTADDIFKRVKQN